MKCMKKRRVLSLWLALLMVMSLTLGSSFAAFAADHDIVVLYTNDVGGILLLEFDKDGYLHFRTEATENDTTYDEIGAVLKIKELQRSEEELLRSLEMYYRVLLANGLG